MSALDQADMCSAKRRVHFLPPIADMCECLAIKRERGSVEAIYCGRSLLCRPTYWRKLNAGSSDAVLSAAYNVEFHFDAFWPARRQ